MNQHKTFFVSKYTYATHSQRLGNFFIDQFVLMVLLFVIFYCNLHFGSASLFKWYWQLNLIEEYFYVELTTAVYYTIIELTFGTTLGKLITRTRIVDLYGEKPYQQSFVIRSFSRMIPFEMFSCLTEYSRGWHDRFSDTYVVDVKEFEKEKQAFDRQQNHQNNE